MRHREANSMDGFGQQQQQQQQHVPPKQQQRKRLVFKEDETLGNGGADSDCSSSSSGSDLLDASAYRLPERTAYGGVRASYVPNDRR